MSWRELLAESGICLLHFGRKRGDIVEVLNTTGPTLSGTDGLGDWNIPWDTWKAGNAGL